MIRVLIVNDSITQREILRRLFASDDELVVIAEARNGQEAVAMVQQHAPDVVLMDIHMPGLDGIAATREIMRICPVPIVIASATLKRRDIDFALQAYEAGEIAVIEKPEGAVLLHLHKMAPELRRELIAASKAKVRRVPLTSTAARTSALPLKRPRISITSAPIDVIGMCASTGGPPILAEIFSHLPKPFPIPILLVQHISHGFEEGFARWLATQSGQTAGIATIGQPLSPGIWLSPGGKHLTLSPRNRIDLPAGQPGETHCPSGNPLFQSLARHRGDRAVGILLTGMGDDGAQGLLEMRRAGGTTVIQDEATSLIWGMPKVGQEIGAAMHELSPLEIAETLSRLCEPRAA